MNKRLWSLAISSALIAGALSAFPAYAQTEPGATGGVVPASPNIVDAGGDANGHSPVTGNGSGLTFGGMDVLTAWFTHDSTNAYVHIQTTTGARAEAVTFQTNVGNKAGLDCIQLRMTTAGEGNDSFSAINVAGDCGDVPTTQYGPLLEEEGPDGTAILTGVFPRADLAVLADGALLAEPDILVGFWGHGNPAAGGSRIGTIENTPVGTDYTVSSGGPTPDPTVSPGDPGPDPDPKPDKPKKKKCKKKANGKKVCPKKKPKPKPPVVPPGPPAGSCPAYVPGELGAEVETTVVTDAATAEKPVEIPLEIGAGFGVGGVFEDAIAHAYHNVQVDSASGSTGLYVRLEMPFPSDYDLYVRNADGSEAARAAGFNPEPAVYNDNTAGGHTEPDAEVIDGVTTADCGGYTIDAGAATGEGGELTLKFWLGEATYTAGGESAMEMFYRTLGLKGGSR